MKKAEIIARYGEEDYNRRLEQGRRRARAWHEVNREKAIAKMRERREAFPEENKASRQKWRDENPEKIIADARERCRKGGKYYEKEKKKKHTGLQGARNRIRVKHANQYRPFKMIIAQDSQIHHEWVPKTAEYNGLALVEKDPHQYGIIDVIQILDGEITLLTEEDIKNGKKKKDEKV